MKEENIKSCLEKLDLLGIAVDEKEQEKIINNINLLPKEILCNLDNSQIIGLVLDNIGECHHLVYSFDMEIFGTNTMYTEFLNNINLFTNNELKIEVIKEKTSNAHCDDCNRKQIIEFKILNEQYKFAAKVNYDWFDISIISCINKIIEQNGLKKYLFVTSDGWQNCIVFYNTDEWAKKYNETFSEVQIKNMIKNTNNI